MQPRLPGRWERCLIALSFEVSIYYANIYSQYGADVANKLTIEELAHQEGVPTSTIRLYVQNGILERPTREGRRSYYGGDHVRTLRSTRRLLDRGFSLAAIRQMLELDRQGEDLATLLADPVESPSYQPTELADLLFAGGEFDEEVLAEAVGSGILSVDESGITFSDHRHLKNALALAELGVPAQAGVAAWVKTRQLVSEVIDELIEMTVPYFTDADDQVLGRVVGLGRDSLQMAYEVEVKRKVADLLP